MSNNGYEFFDSTHFAGYSEDEEEDEDIRSWRRRGGHSRPAGTSNGAERSGYAGNARHRRHRQSERSSRFPDTEDTPGSTGSRASEEEVVVEYVDRDSTDPVSFPIVLAPRYRRPVLVNISMDKSRVGQGFSEVLSAVNMPGIVGRRFPDLNEEESRSLVNQASRDLGGELHFRAALDSDPGGFAPSPSSFQSSRAEPIFQPTRSPGGSDNYHDGRSRWGSSDNFDDDFRPNEFSRESSRRHTAPDVGDGYRAQPQSTSHTFSITGFDGRPVWYTRDCSGHVRPLQPISSRSYGRRCPP